MSDRLITRAEQEFRDAFTRLKNDQPINMPKGTPVSQNNVSLEAGKVSSALRKKRYPELVREIQAYTVPLNLDAEQKRAIKNEIKKNRLNDKEMIKALRAELSDSQSQIVYAHYEIIKTLRKCAELQALYNRVVPPPVRLKRT